MNRKAFTLLELIVVVLIVATLSALAIPRYIRAREYAIAKEAITNLKLIQVAEDVYYSENNSKYYPPTAPPYTIDAVGTINDALHLSLNETYWNYAIVAALDGSWYSATAARISGPYAGLCGYYMQPGFSDPRMADGNTCP